MPWRLIQFDPCEILEKYPALMQKLRSLLAGFFEVISFEVSFTDFYNFVARLLSDDFGGGVEK